jgi:CheY-like chemotaxis protein
LERLDEDNDYEMILMDIQMPVMDGYEATVKIREKDLDLPIVALTANAMKEDEKKALELGMNKHLSKPVQIKQLHETLLEFLSPKTDEIEEDDETLELNEFSQNIPPFDHLDVNIALQLVMGDVKVFSKMLTGMLKYKELNLFELKDDEFARTIHTLKGLSASIGAQELSEMAKQIEQRNSKELLRMFQEKIARVLDEIEEKLPLVNEKLTQTELREKLSKGELDGHMEELKSALQQFDTYALDILEKIKPTLMAIGEDESTRKLSRLIDSYEFDDALIECEKIIISLQNSKS